MEFNIFWVLVIALFIYLVKQNGDKYFRKFLGSMFIVGGLYIAGPWPGLEDFLLFPLFSSFMNWEMGLAGFKANFLPYSVITTILGLGVAYLGIYISGYKLSYLINKLKRMFNKYL